MKQKWEKRIARAMFPCFVFFVFSFSLAPKAHAAEANISVSYWLGSLVSQTGDTPISNGSVMTSTRVPTDGYAGPFGPQIISSATVWHSGFATIYFSFRGQQYSTISHGDFYDMNNWIISYDNSNGVRVEDYGIDKIYEFPVGDSVGYSCQASFVGSEGEPITRLAVRSQNIGYITSINTNWQPVTWNVGLIYPSIRIITTESSVELEQLDKVADELAKQSDLLLAMKGDLVAILQDIYAMTGDIHIAQNLLNTYVSQMLPLLEDIDQTTTNIYALLSTQLRALETAIETAATSIEAAISAQTAAMIAYLESVLNTGNEVPDDTYQQQQDAANILDQMESLEKPNVDTIVPEIGDYSDSGVSGVLSAIFSSNLIVTMMTLSASFAFGAYVLFGKRD